MKCNVPDYVVGLRRRKGRGVLVGDVILTAAHCIEFNTNGNMAMGEHFIEEIETCKGTIKARPIAIEPCSDIAVLGALDGQTFFDEEQAFEEFCHTIKPVRIARRTRRKAFPVRILNKDESWTRGIAAIWGNDSEPPQICIEADREIKGGASGGPILNTQGELIGIVSHFSIPNKEVKSTGLAPLPLHSLPVWVARKYLGA